MRVSPVPETGRQLTSASSYIKVRVSAEHMFIVYDLLAVNLDTTDIYRLLQRHIGTVDLL